MRTAARKTRRQSHGSSARNGGNAGATAAKQAIRAENVAKILEAAEAVFATKGFSGATTAEIAARAELPKANLHYYFRTKQALYRAVLDDILSLWLDATASIVPEAEPAVALEAAHRDVLATLK